MVEGETTEFNLNYSFHTCNLSADISFLRYNYTASIVNHVNLSSVSKEKGYERSIRRALAKI